MLPLFSLITQRCWAGLILFCSLLLAGCAADGVISPSNATEPDMTAVAAQGQPMETMTPTVAATPTATPIAPSPTATTTPQPTPTSTLTPTATPTITPAPTLTIDEEGAFLSELMATNGGCELPCWWGVVPGVIEDQTARDMFVSRGINHWNNALDESYRELILGHPPAGSSSYRADVGFRFWAEEGVVQFIYVSEERQANNQSPFFNEHWRQYTPAEILNRYGIPTYVQFEVQIPADPGTVYNILGLSYPALGIEAHYWIAVEILAVGRYLVCSSFDRVDFVDLMLFPPNRAMDYPGYETPSYLQEYTSWEMATGTDLAAFYETFKDPNQESCTEVGD